MTSRDTAAGPGPAGSGGSDGAPEAAKALAARMASTARETVRAVILYGSHLSGAAPDHHSALDFVVIVDDYRRFYQAMHDAGELHRPVWLMAALARVLAPNVIAYAPDHGSDGIAKCLVVSLDDFARAVASPPPDHFLVARLVQKVAIIWATDDARARWVDDKLTEARADVLTWVGPWLEGPFDAEDVGRKLLEVCYRSEFRPEARNRADVIFSLQQEHFRAALAPVLENAVRAQTLTQVGERGYRLAAPASSAERRRWRAYFRRSKARVTARWLKHIFTFDNWLPYVVRKVERRTGKKVVLTRLERRWPLIFLWPRALGVLLTRPDREEPS